MVLTTTCSKLVSVDIDQSGFDLIFFPGFCYLGSSQFFQVKALQDLTASQETPLELWVDYGGHFWKSEFHVCDFCLD